MTFPENVVTNRQKANHLLQMLEFVEDNNVFSKRTTIQASVQVYVEEYWHR